MERLTREKALDRLLAPIEFHGSTRTSRNEVSRRRHDVCTALPFMEKKEAVVARAWLRVNQHKDLWE